MAIRKIARMGHPVLRQKATVFQHELDHLDGTLYLDQVKDTRKFSFLEEYRRYWLPQAED